jgi:hypothetical protein
MGAAALLRFATDAAVAGECADTAHGIFRTFYIVISPLGKVVGIHISGHHHLTRLAVGDWTSYAAHLEPETRP